ncbi:G-protein coupled receptor 26 [Esox lucius]|uniref:G-protein coupled receptors family 1 profile domain-containing protein n=1 Tax=Esox lucius TaxID=8010 RepID=A0A3P8ZT40_ESOLU|nr:G-protein coupled receptor 26 [Esox lucius]
MNWTDVLLEAVIVSVVVVSLVSNLLVLLCFVQSSEIRAQVPGVFLLNLSISNILTSTVNMPSTLFGIALRGQPFGDAFCRAVSFLETFLTANAMLSMAALGVDRWLAVVFPLSYSSRLQYRDALVVLGCCWLHSVAFSLAALLMSWGAYSDTYASCSVCLAGGARSAGGAGEFAVFAAFTVLFHCSTFALCLVVMCFAYLKVLRVARLHCRRIDVVTVQTLLLVVDIHPSVKERCLAEQRKRRQRATKKICIFIGTFILCFGPHVITRLLELLPQVSVGRDWGVATRCLSYAKAACDPFVYSLLRQQFRKVLGGFGNRVLRQDRYLISTSAGRQSSSSYDTSATDDFPIRMVT